MKVVIIGTGNTATILGRLMKEKGHVISEVYGRDAVAASALASDLQSTVISDLSTLTTHADLYVVAVSDKAIESIVGSIRLVKGILVHTAGSVSMSVLNTAAKNCGILYPLQSLRKESMELPNIPFLVDGNTEETQTILVDFACSLSKQVTKANDEQRKLYHLGAVVVNNFPNYLYAKTADFCRSKGIEFSMLFPLISYTGSRLKQFAPQQTQTGPAVRNDTETMSKHLALIEGDDQLQEIYRLFSIYIAEYFKEKS